MESNPIGLDSALQGPTHDNEISILLKICNRNTFDALFNTAQMKKVDGI